MGARQPTAFNTQPAGEVPVLKSAGTGAPAGRCLRAMRELDDISEKEILSAKAKSEIAEDLSVSTGVFGALCVTALLLLGLFMLHGSTILPTMGHSLFAMKSDAPLSPRAAVAMRFYFDEPHRQM
jgi:hypothetical protein